VTVAVTVAVVLHATCGTTQKQQRVQDIADLHAAPALACINRPKTQLWQHYYQGLGRPTCSATQNQHST
jgi:hypothetical protein